MYIEVISQTATQKSVGAPILFIHGAWHGAWCWDHFQSYFSEQGYTSYALSLRGHGASEGRDRLHWFRAADYVKDVAQIANQLPQPPILIGHSMGGYIIQKYLERYSVPAAVLLASAPVRSSIKMFLRLTRRHPWQMLKCHLTWNSHTLIETPKLAQEAFFSVDMSEKTLNGYFAQLQDESYFVGWDTVILDLPRPRRVNMPPMLVIGADKDRLFSRGEIEATARAYHALVEFIPDMAHDMMLEKDWKKVSERIVVWLHEQGF